ncbi:MAG: c-type cytochrome [Bacteroidota bacterium]
MPNSNKKTVIATASFIFLAVTFTLFAQVNKKKDEKAKNLKVMPKDISHDDLDRQMDFFCGALSVKCNYCHADSKTRPGKLDFAADSASRHKEDGRRMLELTYSINEKYFGIQRTEPMSKQVVNCYTCHRGEEFPMVEFDSIANKPH